MEFPEAEGNNAKKFRGVYQTKSGNWVVKVYDRSNGKTAHLGTFKNAEDAAIAYDKAALRIYGPEAKLNFPDSHVSYAHSVDTLSSGGETRPFKRKRPSQSSDPMLLQEQAKEMDETKYYADFVSQDVGNVDHRDSSVKYIEDALGFLDGNGSIMSFLMAAIEEPVQQTLPGTHIFEAERNVAGHSDGFFVSK